MKQKTNVYEENQAIDILVLWKYCLCWAPLKLGTDILVNSVQKDVSRSGMCNF